MNLIVACLPTSPFKDRVSDVHREALAEIEHLRKIEEAAKNLIAVKGRHHSEMAYKRLEDVLK